MLIKSQIQYLKTLFKVFIGMACIFHGVAKAQNGDLYVGKNTILHGLDNIHVSENSNTSTALNKKAATVVFVSGATKISGLNSISNAKLIRQNTNTTHKRNVSNIKATYVKTSQSKEKTEYKPKNTIRFPFKNSPFKGVFLSANKSFLVVNTNNDVYKQKRDTIKSDYNNMFVVAALILFDNAKKGEENSASFIGENRNSIYYCRPPPNLS